MTDTECDEVYRRLTDMLLQPRMKWLVDEVEAEIAFGRDEIVKVKPVRENISSSTGPGVRPELERRLGTSQDFMRTVPFSQKDRLRLLIDAIELVVADTADMEKSFFDSLLNTSRVANRQVPAGVHFIDPLTGQVVHELNAGSSAARHSEAQVLRKQLNELRRDI